MELEGKPLAFWLQELLTEESERRSRAAELLTRVDDEFKAAVYIALSVPEFPREAWLYALVDFLFWAQETRMAAHHRERERSNRVWEKLQERYPTPQALQSVQYRLHRWANASLDPNNRNEREYEILLSQQVAARMVLDGVGKHILAVPACVRRMLADKHYRKVGTDLLYGLGPHALEEFGEEAMADPNFPSYALAALIRKSPEHIREVANRLHEPLTAERYRHTLHVLALLGPVVHQAAPDCIPTVMALLDVSEHRASAIRTLGAVTQGQELLVDRFLEFSYSDDIWIKKAALEALGIVAACPERVVPRLIAAFEDYSEPDSDDMHYSQHTVVTRALQRFGAQASAAVPALIERIVQDDTCITLHLDGTQEESNFIDSGVIHCLIAIGPAALPALPVLEKLAPDDEVAALEMGGAPEGYCPSAIAVYRLRQYRRADILWEHQRLYTYVGLDMDWAKTDLCQVISKEALKDWIQKTFDTHYPAEITLTYVVLPPGELWVAERHSEHVSCARGKPVLAAGELTLQDLTVTEISNLSTGYCPAPQCWPAVESALKAAGLEGPSAFTQSFLFRRCPDCYQRQIVREGEFTCCFCNGALSLSIYDEHHGGAL